MLDLRSYSVNEFAKLVDIDFDTISNMLQATSHLGYVNNPYACIVAKVLSNEKIASDKKEIVSKFIYTCIKNNSLHRFYNGRGYAINPTSYNN